MSLLVTHYYTHLVTHYCFVQIVLFKKVSSKNTVFHYNFRTKGNKGLSLGRLVIWDFVTKRGLSSLHTVRRRSGVRCPVDPSWIWPVSGVPTNGNKYSQSRWMELDDTFVRVTDTCTTLFPPLRDGIYCRSTIVLVLPPPSFYRINIMIYLVCNQLCVL